ncbi:MAG TPA: hypothetical protein DD719_07080 [Desulfotomaculum sp.]|jgi:predicted pyridoxine 5'-phosphate oxidase superfamily flavin-nucleotide-binding protein|nr:hypothetical protein [Desulfotomaculum sp.]HCJ79223.1 hypothetical protein [Desulfotomaculum sp.]
MAKIPEEVIEALADKNSVKMMATVDKEKKVNLVPIGSVRVLDEERLAYACCFNGKTKSNLETTKRAAVAIFKPPMDGYQVKGMFVKWETSGELYEQMNQALSATFKKLGVEGKVDAVGIIKVTEAYALSLPIAGEKLA